VNITPTLKNLDHPLDKIFETIPAGSSHFTHASVTDYKRNKIPVDFIIFLFNNRLSLK
jgi:hypothetical protein